MRECSKSRFVWVGFGQLAGQGWGPCGRLRSGTQGVWGQERQAWAWAWAWAWCAVVEMGCSKRVELAWGWLCTCLGWAAGGGWWWHGCPHARCGGHSACVRVRARWVVRSATEQGRTMSRARWGGGSPKHPTPPAPPRPPPAMGSSPPCDLRPCPAQNVRGCCMYVCLCLFLKADLGTGCASRLRVVAGRHKSPEQRLNLSGS